MLSLFKSIFIYSANFFKLISNKVDVKALELKEKNETEINISVLRNDYEEQVNIALNDQYQKFETLTKECILLDKSIKTDKNRLEIIAKEIIRADNEYNTVNKDEMDEIKLMSLDYSLKNMRLEAKTLLSDVQFNERFLGDQTQTKQLMAKQYHENRYRAKQVIRELKSLEQRNSLVESRSSIEQLELGISNYKISDIIRIVEGKEAAIEAKGFASSVLLKEGSKTALDYRVEEAESKQLDDDLNSYLLNIKETSTAKLVS